MMKTYSGTACESGVEVFYVSMCDFVNAAPDTWMATALEDRVSVIPGSSLPSNYTEAAQDLAGWYWRPSSPGSDPNGPFDSEGAALTEAQKYAARGKSSGRSRGFDMLKQTRAQRDEACEWCGYPFDTGDKALTDETESYVYCSRHCGHRHAVCTEAAKLRKIMGEGVA